MQERSLIEKNYISHLTRLHPAENLDDIIPLGQKTISKLSSNLKKESEGTTDIQHLETSDDISRKVGETSKRRLEINYSHGVLIQGEDWKQFK